MKSTSVNESLFTQQIESWWNNCDFNWKYLEFFRERKVLLKMHLNEILNRDLRTTLSLPRILTESLSCTDLLSCENIFEFIVDCDKCSRHKSQKTKHFKSLYLMPKSKLKCSLYATEWNRVELIVLIDYVFARIPIALITRCYTSREFPRF